MAKTRLRKVPETTNNITKGIVNLINSTPKCHAFRVNTTGIYDPVKGVFRKSRNKGTADIIACMHGRFIAIEIKLGRDKQSEDQEIFEKGVRSAEGTYVVIKHFEDFKIFFTYILSTLC